MKLGPRSDLVYETSFSFTPNLAMVCLGKTDDASLTDPNRVRTKECEGHDDLHKCSTSMVHILFLKTVVQYCDFMSCVFFDCNLWILCYFREEGSGFWVFARLFEFSFYAETLFLKGLVYNAWGWGVPK